MAALRTALWLAIVGALIAAGANHGWSQVVPRVTTPVVPHVTIPTPMPQIQIPQPQIQIPTPPPRFEAPVARPAQPLPQAAPPAAAARPRAIVRARLARAVSVAGNSRCDITASLQERCRRGQSCKLSCLPSLCPQLGGQTFCEFALDCAVEFVGRVVMDDPVCKTRTEVKLITAPGGGRSYLVTVPVGYECEPPECAR
jgi:hypothetical protein